jgi:hypothetical protein
LVGNLLESLLFLDLNTSVLLNQIKVLLIELPVLLPPLFPLALVALSLKIRGAAVCSQRTRAIFVTILNLIIISNEVFEL